jgi:hypothetical protein
MAGFWFLVSVVLVVVLLTRRKSNDEYAQGYWNGYRAFGDMVRDLIAQKRVNEDALRALIDIGETGGVSQPETQAVQNVAVANQPAVISDPEAQFFADTYDTGDELPDIDAQVEPVVSVPTPVPVAPVSVEDAAAQKAARSLRNLNIILYTASFLLVAAGALFVASSSSPLTKLISVIIVIAAFYVSGYAIYIRSERLRPAALAFLGTGLALIPFAGFALQQYTNLSTAQSWLLTSIVGLVAYFLVAIRLQSQLVSYLTMAFVLSLAGSMTAAAASAIVWQFVVIIVVSLTASVVAYLKPKWLPAVFSQPVERSGQIVTPVALGASLFVFDRLRLSGYEIVFAVATLHYIVAWLQSREMMYETVVRVISYFTLALVAWDVWDGNIAFVAFSLVLLFTFQHAYSLSMALKPGRSAIEQNWLVVLFGLQLLLVPFWLYHALAAEFSTIALTIIGATSLIAAIRLRRVDYGLIGLGISLALPFIVARGLLTPVLPWWALAVWFMVAAIAALWLYARWRQRSAALRYFMTGAYIAYLFLALWAAGLQQSLAFTTVSYVAIAGFLLVASYVARNPVSQVSIVPFILLATVSLGWLLHISGPWLIMFTSVVSACVLWVGVIIHGHYKELTRQTIMLASGQFAFLLMLAAIGFGNLEATKIVIILLLIGSILSLALRWFYEVQAAHLNIVFTLSYVLFFVAAFFGSSTLDTTWWLVASLIGVALFTLASYVERWPLLQGIAGGLALISLGQIASLIALPNQWQPLFIFGGAGTVYYLAGLLHKLVEQAQRQFMMVVMAQIAMFFVIFGGFTGHYYATMVSFIILLVWSALSLGLRWVSLGKSELYRSVLLLSYPIYYFGALMLVGPLASTWAWVTLTGVGVVLALAASYIEKQRWLQILASVLVVVTFAFVASLVDMPSEWRVPFVFGGSAVLFYLLAAIHRYLQQKERQLLMVVLAHATLLMIIFSVLSGSYVVSLVSFSILLTWSVLLLGIRTFLRDHSPEYVSVSLAFYPTYYVAAMLALSSLATVWSVVAFAVGVVIFWVASYVERMPVLSILGDILLIITINIFWDMMQFNSEWKLIIMASIVAAIFYASHWILAQFGDSWRARMQLWATWLVLGLVILIEFWDPTKIIAISALIIAFAGTLAVYGLQVKRPNVVEVAAYIATFALQRIVEQVWPGLNVVFYAHWWAITLAVVVLLRVRYGRERLVIAMSLITLSTGIYALTHGGNYQLLFLLEHLALLVAGALLSKSWAIWWGIVASALAILYFLRTYTFLLLGFLGLLLIGIVVWRLMRSKA